MILWELHAQVRRFGELRRLLAGISEKMLIQQLRELEADGLVKRQVFHEVPPRVEYSATKLGNSLTRRWLRWRIGASVISRKRKAGRRGRNLAFQRDP